MFSIYISETACTYDNSPAIFSDRVMILRASRDPSFSSLLGPEASLRWLQEIADIAMGLCETCSSITVHALTRDLPSPPRWWTEVNRSKSSKGMAHFRDARHIISSAKTCRLCSLMKAAVSQFAAGQKFPRESDIFLPGNTYQWDGEHFERHIIDEPIFLRPKKDYLDRAFTDSPVPGAEYLRGFTVFIPVAGDVLTGLVRLYAQHGNHSVHRCTVKQVDAKQITPPR
jgi:hypothetical protein